MPRPDLMRRPGIALTDYATVFNPAPCLTPFQLHHPLLQQLQQQKSSFQENARTHVAEKTHVAVDVTFPGHELIVMC